MFGLAAASALILYSLSTCVLAQSPAKPLPTLTHADQIRRLSPEQAALGYPVRIRGVITMDAPVPDFFVQDATAGIYTEGSVSPKWQLQDRTVQLNVKTLQLNSDGDVPEFVGRPTRSGRISFAPASITFLAIPNASNSSCR